MTDLPAREALAEVARVRRRIRSLRWWHVAAGLVTAVSLTVYYVAMAAWPDEVDVFVLPWLAVTAGILLLIRWRMRAVPREAARLEEKAVWISVGLALVTIAVNNLLLPPGLSVWIVLTGVLPALPFLYAAWRVGRR
ncbi:hypothetical protein [Phytomonospora endophytica]|uniref:Phosphatidylserine synthase n=1 Tax=Phytomonospora endophytica TaxID=714109 RepID=A0A841FBL4_9ACTN|nr:hypothetical protein [Phytomonospora endophytica]MBB6032735.1 phosphatidylserine synthase [Phytomonospora endophytica]GIG66116.1 hypothetical protein Pen01_24110 [Phytomonospora endophytica]